MGTMLQPLVVHSQQLIIGYKKNSIGVTKNQNEDIMLSTDHKINFSKRLRELCEEAKVTSQSALAREFRVSQESARKWLKGESWPSNDHLIEICNRFNVNFEWLATGKPPKRRMPEGEELDIDMSDKELIALIKLVKQLPKENRDHAKRLLDVADELTPRREKKKTQSE